jgi:O-antigen/teichoic acid export membrane protein
MVRIQDHLAKLTWTAADKFLFIGYGFVNILQNNALPTHELGLYALFMALQTFLFSVSDGFVLQSIIIFGADKTKRGAINRFAMTWHSVITLGGALLLLLLQEPIAWLLGEERIAVVVRYLPLLCFVTIPRKLCEKYLQRDVQAREIFIINAVWFGTMTALTAYFLAMRQLSSLEVMVLIATSGMAASSIVAVLLTKKQLSLRGAKSHSWRQFFVIGAYQGSSGLLGNMVKQLDVTVLQYFFGTATVGVYQSAKTLFRFFDEGFNAIAGLVYPATVRLVHEGKSEQLQALLSKMLSFSMAAMVLAIVLVQIGVAEWAISHILASKYAAAIGYFKLLVFAAPAMPFAALIAVIIAFGEGKILLKNVVIAVVCAFTALISIGVLGLPEFAPIGIMTYYIVMGILCFEFTRSRLHFPLELLWRFVPDTLDFLNVWKKK